MTDRIRRVARAAAGVALLSCVPALAAMLPLGAPNGLKIVDWTQIRAEYERHRHAAFQAPNGGCLQARSFEQQWMASFDGRGFSVVPDEGNWTWGLQLTNFAGAAKVSSDVNRIVYSHSANLDEWFLNGPAGLEHGFTVRAPQPPLRLDVRGGLRARATAAGIEFADSAGAARIKYTGLHAFDADGKPLQARMTVEAGQVVLTVETQGARYPVTIDPVAQQAYLKGSPNANDKFGSSVAISGDTVVVGAYFESKIVSVNNPTLNLANSGAAYVFVRSGTAWIQQAILKASNEDTNQRFGNSVAISGETVVVGAPGESSNATGVNGNQSDKSKGASGAAYVFLRIGGVWSQQAYLKASNTDAGDQFGFSVAVSGDTVAVGAFQEDSSATGVNGTQSDNSKVSSGSAYVFARSGGVWSQQAYLKASNTEADDSFGISVTVSGDTVVVGAYEEDSGATGVNGSQSDNGRAGSGAAYVFVRSGTTWSQQAYLKASNTDIGSNFGYSVAISGDTIVVGARNESSAATGVNGNQGDHSRAQSGAAYIFTRSGGTWSQQAYLKASNTDFSDFFGINVAISGDTVVVGAYAEDSGAAGVDGNQSDNSKPDSGAVYVFARSGTTWSQQAYLKASNPDPGDWFGLYVGVSGDTVVAGAQLEDSNGLQSDNSKTSNGAAYVFVVPATTVAVTIASSPSGLSFTTSGAGCAPGSYIASQTLGWTPGSSCLVSFDTPQSGGTGIQYQLNQWEDGSTAAARSITAPASAATYTASFGTQYLLTTVAGPGGSVSPGGYLAAGANASITATPSTGFSFVNFTGAVTSTSNPLSLTMDGPKTVTANFAPVGTPLLTAAILSKVDGAATNERVWTVQASNAGSGSALHPRIASVQILAANPAANLPLISLGSTVYPAAFPTVSLSPGQSTSIPISIIFPATVPVTRIQFRINLAADNGYASSITLSNQVR